MTPGVEQRRPWNLDASRRARSASDGRAGCDLTVAFEIRFESRVGVILRLGVSIAA
jgi:hypothetical protein